MTINEHLRILRELQGISLRTAAKRTGISPSTLSRLENGAMSPSPENLKKLSETYKASYEGLMKRAGYLDNHDQAVQYRRLLADLDVSDDEARELLDYLEYMRWRRNKRRREGLAEMTRIAQESGEYD